MTNSIPTTHRAFPRSWSGRRWSEGRRQLFRFRSTEATCDEALRQADADLFWMPRARVLRLRGRVVASFIPRHIRNFSLITPSKRLKPTKFPRGSCGLAGIGGTGEMPAEKQQMFSALSVRMLKVGAAVKIRLRRREKEQSTRADSRKITI